MPVKKDKYYAALSLERAIAKREAPGEIEIMTVGETYDIPGYGPHTFTMDDLLSTMEFERAKRTDNLDTVIDWEHATRDDEAKEAPASGWIDGMEIRGQALIARVKEWTPRAREQIENGEYKYTSPHFFWFEYDENEKRLTSAYLDHVALTNLPKRRGRGALFAKEGIPFNQAGIGLTTEDAMKEFLQKMFAALSLKAVAADEKGQQDEAVKAVEGLVKLRDKAVAGLALKADDLTPESIDKAIGELKKPADPPKFTDDEKAIVAPEILAALGLKAEATVGDLKKAIIGIKAGTEGDLATRVAKLEGDIGSQRIADAVASLKADGKIIPAEEDGVKKLLALDFDTAMETYGKRKALALKDRLPGGEPPKKDQVDPALSAKFDHILPLSEEEKKIRDRLAS